MSALLTGGLAAAAVAAWSQVKTVLGYLSSFVLVCNRVEASMLLTVLSQVKRDYKKLPSGSYAYRMRYMRLDGARESIAVPFRLMDGPTVYRRGLSLIFVNETTQTFTHLRGAVDFNALVVRAQKASIEESTSMLKSSSRYRVVTYVGQDKTLPPVRGGESLVSSGGSPVGTSTERWPDLDTSIDKSFMYDSSRWTNVNGIHSPFDTLYYPPDIMAYVEQARRWMSRRQWYMDRSIPWRRGWLLKGPGGTGKTSLAMATAEELRIPVYHFYLATMSDQEFITAWDGMSLPAVALLEDFDNVFDKRTPVGKTMLSFETVLNKISGTSSAGGLFLIVSTNDETKIDPAMGVSFEGGISTRPGRIDSVIHVGFMDHSGRQLMAQRILRDWPESVDAIVNEYQEITASQFQEVCLQRALQHMADQEEDLPEDLPGDSEYVIRPSYLPQ